MLDLNVVCRSTPVFTAVILNKNRGAGGRVKIKIRICKVTILLRSIVS